MGQAKLRGVKGCRPLYDVQLDFTNTCAAYGGANFRKITLEKDIFKLRRRLEELQLELDAAERMEKLKKAGLDAIAFAWAGETEKGKKHYYRLQGPTFLVEYDNTQNDGNHIHSVWRDFNGDFGRDLLREHLAALPH